MKPRDPFVELFRIHAFDAAERMVLFGAERRLPFYLTPAVRLVGLLRHIVRSPEDGGDGAWPTTIPLLEAVTACFGLEAFVLEGDREPLRISAPPEYATPHLGAAMNGIIIPTRAHDDYRGAPEPPSADRARAYFARYPLALPEALEPASARPVREADVQGSPAPSDTAGTAGATGPTGASGPTGSTGENTTPVEGAWPKDPNDVDVAAKELFQRETGEPWTSLHPDEKRPWRECALALLTKARS